MFTNHYGVVDDYSQSHYHANHADEVDGSTEAVEDGDIKVSLQILKGIGTLGGTMPSSGVTDARELKAESERTEFMRNIGSG